MDAILILAILASPIVLALLVHIFRDIRGKSRNSRDACYSCGEPLNAIETRIAILHAGGIYAYCMRCHYRQELWKGIAISFAALVGAATLGVVALSQFDSNPNRSYLLVATAFVIVAFVVFIWVRLARRR